MNDKEYEKQKKRVEKLFKKWRDPLGLGWWRITISYSREHAKGDTRYAPPDVNGIYDCVFDITCDYYYKIATIEAYLPVIKDIKDENLERYFIHEMMHIILKPMQHKEKAPDEELVATSLADAFLWVVEGVKEKKL